MKALTALNGEIQVGTSMTHQETPNHIPPHKKPINETTAAFKQF